MRSQKRKRSIKHRIDGVGSQKYNIINFDNLMENVYLKFDQSFQYTLLLLLI